MRSIFKIIVLLTNEFPWFQKKSPKVDFIGICFLFSYSYRDRQFFFSAVCIQPGFENCLFGSCISYKRLWDNKKKTNKQSKNRKI